MFLNKMAAHRALVGVLMLAFMAGPVLAEISDDGAKTQAAPAPISSSSPTEKPMLGLMGTIPIYWGEADGLAQQISGDYQPHWARAFLEQDFDLSPLDFLSAENIEGHQRLLLAQPRGLAPEENVALDEWVRAGGQLLLFADPWMTGQSRFAIGDRRRPQAVTLLSPLLGHWGLHLKYDDAGEAHVHSGPAEHSSRSSSLSNADGARIPVNSPGRFTLGDAVDDCQLSEDAILVQCVIGQGSVVILGDAALLDLGPAKGARQALSSLLDRAFGSIFSKNRENAGSVNLPSIARAVNGGKPPISTSDNMTIVTGDPPG